MMFSAPRTPSLPILSALLLGCLMVTYALPALAGSGGKAEGDHWSFFTAIIPEAAVTNAQNIIGITYIDKEQASKVMHVPAALFAALISLLFGIVGGRRFKTEEAIRPAPTISVAGIVELFLEGIYNIMAGVMEEKWARKAFPLLATITIYVLISNYMGSLPGLFPPTDNLNTTLSMAIVVFCATHYYGVQAQGFANYCKHFCGPIIKWYALPLMVLMLAIEIIGHLARPASLSIRLMGNMTADHKVLAIFLGFGLVLVPIPVQILGLIVSSVQALVFLLLSAVYIGLAVDHGDEH